MRGVSQEECAPFPKVFRDPVVTWWVQNQFTFGPLPQGFECPIADVLEGQVVGVAAFVVADGADQSARPCSAKGKIARKSESSRSTFRSPFKAGPSPSMSAT